jgi:hypothetical protein
MRGRVVSVSASEQAENSHLVLDCCWTSEKGGGSSRHSHHKYGRLKCIFCSVVSLRRISPSVSYEVEGSALYCCMHVSWGPGASDTVPRPPVASGPRRGLSEPNNRRCTLGLLTCMSCNQCGSWVSKLFVESYRLARPWLVRLFVQRERGSGG